MRGRLHATRLRCAALCFCAGLGASAEVAACDIETSRAEPSKSVNAEWHRFTASSDRFEILRNGSGTRQRSDGTEQRFDLPLPERFSVEDVYWSTIDGDLLMVYGISNGEDGAGRVALLKKSDLLPRWVADIPSFNVGEPLCVGTSLFVTALGWVAKLDLRDGKLLWQHRDLYERASGAFNLFLEPVLQGNEVRFAEDRWRERPGPRYTLVVDAETGQLVRREERPQNDGYPGDVTMIELGRARDLAGLERARELYLRDATRAQRFAIFVASRLATPEEFAEEFVDSIPTQPGDGWLHLDGYAEAWRYEEYLVADQLARIAVTGNRTAIRKLLQLATWADGGWSEVLYDGVVRCLIAHPEVAIDELADRSPQERLHILESAFALSLSDEDRITLLASVRGARTPHSRLQVEIESVATSAQQSIRNSRP